MLKRNILLNIALATSLGLSSQVLFASGLEKCSPCKKTKGTLQLMDHKLADNKSSKNKEKTSHHQKSHDSNDNTDRSTSSKENSEQSGLEKGNDRENDMSAGD